MKKSLSIHTTLAELADIKAKEEQALKEAKEREQAETAKYNKDRFYLKFHWQKLAKKAKQAKYQFTLF